MLPPPRRVRTLDRTLAVSVEQLNGRLWLLVDRATLKFLCAVSVVVVVCVVVEMILWLSLLWLMRRDVARCASILSHLARACTIQPLASAFGAAGPRSQPLRPSSSTPPATHCDLFCRSIAPSGSVGERADGIYGGPGCWWYGILQGSWVGMKWRSNWLW